jgi:hypothetical protein
MADEADRANDLAQWVVDMARKAPKEAPLAVIGRCHNCDEESLGAFCCKECREDFEKRQKVMRISGRL